MQKGQKKRLILNTVSSLVFQGVTIISGFILPRLILANYGSDINGLVNSISQFLGIISFLELGVGAVIQSALYKPLAEKDHDQVSRIIASGNRFFRRLAMILLIYVVALILFYPFAINKQFSFLYTGTLIAAMCISSFSQYYFGMTAILLLTADQKAYIQNVCMSALLLINTFASVFIIKLGGSIQLVKLTTSLIFLIRPIILRLYVNRHYRIDRRIQYEEEPIHQKWNGIAQHIAAVILDGTDTIVLTLLSSLSDVSIYGVYHLVVSGVRTLFLSMVGGIQSLLGELWAKQEIDQLRKTFDWTEWTIHTAVTFVFGCTASLIVPFVRVYTLGVHDADYDVPLFAILITLAYAMFCYRQPYIIMILAGGHYKQTQKNYIFAAIINVVISVATVKLCGLVGVAIGTLVAMLYQTIWMAWYDSKAFLNLPVRGFLKHMCVNAVCAVPAFLLCRLIQISQLTYLSWVILAVKHAAIWGAMVVIINLISYPEYMKTLIRRVKYNKLRKFK